MKPDPKQMAEGVVALFSSAGNDPELTDRMGFAQTVVQMHFTSEDDEDAVCTVWLDRNPLEAEMGESDDAEIEITGPVEVWLGMIGGQIDMAMAIVRGELTYTGPVRKFLRVVPILQSFDFSEFRGARLDDEEQQRLRDNSEGAQMIEQGQDPENRQQVGEQRSDESGSDSSGTDNGRQIPPPPPPPPGANEGGTVTQFRNS